MSDSSNSPILKRGLLRDDEVRMRAAFTLLELLVTIGIVLVLAALLYTSLAKIRLSADKATCASNLRNIGIATFAYVGDNNGFLPVAHNTTSGEGYWDLPVGAWYVALAPYLDVPVRAAPRDLGDPPPGSGISRPIVFTCPSHKIVFPHVRPVSYAPVINSAARAPWIDNQFRRGRLTSVLNPSKKIWIQDSSSANVYNDNGGNYSIPDGPAYTPFLRHGNAVNALFFDGHVESIPYDRVSPTAPNTESPLIYRPYE